MNDEKRFCDCGCKRKLIKRPKESHLNFKGRKFFNRQCVDRSRYGKEVGPIDRGKTVFHPAIDNFLYGFRKHPT